MTHRGWAVDGVVLGYVALESAVGLSRLPQVPEARWILLANTLIVALVVLVRHARTLARQDRLGPLGRSLVELYPILVLVASYGALDVLAGRAGIATWDTTVQRWELALFGEQVSRTWWQRSMSPFWSTLLHAAYLSYYLIVPAGLIWFLWRDELSNLRRTVFWLAVTFALCYATFLLFPVAGPNYEFPAPTGRFIENPPARLVYGLLAGGSSYGAAFPSSHIAAALVATGAVTLGAPRLGAALVVPTLLLIVATVYCQMHYAVDAIAGVGVGLGVVLTMLLVERRRPGSRQSAAGKERSDRRYFFG